MESGTGEAGSHTGRVTKRRLGHDQKDEVANNQGPQERRRDDQVSSSIYGSATSPGPASRPFKHNRRGDTADDGRPSKRPRKTRSGDITKATQPKC